MGWLSLHTHSQYSILDAMCSVQGLAEKAKAFGMKALALTDHGNMYGAIDFYKACKEAGVKPILGCEVWLAPGSRLEKKKQNGVVGYPLVLLAKNNTGYHNLCRISSIGFREGFYYFPRIDKETLALYAEGLICLSGPNNSHICSLAVEGAKEAFYKEAEWYRNLFKEDYYFQLQRHRMTEEHISEDGLKREDWVYEKYISYVQKQEMINLALVEASKELKIPYVATNDVHYLERSDFKAHEVLINIQSGEPTEIWEKDSKGNLKARVPNPKRDIYPSHEFYFKSPSDMEELFKDLPDAIENTEKIAAKCSLEIDFKTRHYPVFVPPSLEGKTVDKQIRMQEAEKFLYNLCVEAIPKRYTPTRLQKVKEKYPDIDPLQVVKERLDYEFKVLSSKGMCDYLLIVYDFINWAKHHQIPVGPGRGSAAGSIIAYLSGITDIEPLRFHLFFERFINPERVSYPDIDVDICMERRGEVIDYTIQKYGKERVAQIITFGTMKAKMAIKDVGRVLSIPLPKVNAIAKLVPEDPNMTLDKALQMDPELKNLYETDDEAKEILSTAKKLEGSVRNTSIHAAGTIISAEPIIDHIPLCTAKDTEMLVTQYSMKPVEAVGMLKIDFLGLKTLTSIQKTVQDIAKNHQIFLDSSDLPLENLETFQMLNQGKTLGVFQLESAGMQELAKQLHIDNFEEIIAVGALYRPGPMDMIPSFIARKHGREEIELDHPLMKEILQETYGVMVYQEQVMQIASKLAGYSLGEGDMLRRAMGKKDKEEMSRQREKFIQGALKNGIDDKTAILIFDKIEKFASYGFNKSHAAAYAYLTYATAYLKANFPQEWMAALMTSDKDDLSKVAKFILEAKSMGIAILPPDVNESAEEFMGTKEGIRFALSGIKGIGSAVVQAILQERELKPFESLYDFIKRIDTSKVGKKNIELLIQAGAFDFTKWPRDSLRESLDGMFEKVSFEQKEESKGIMNFFSLLEEEKTDLTPPTVKLPTPKADLLKLEKELLGFYLTGHPMDSYQKLIQRLGCISCKDFSDTKEEIFKSSFIVEAVEFRISNKNQKKFALLTISDGIERFELPIWNQMYEEKSTILQENKLLFAVLQKEEKEDNLRLSCKHLEDLTLMGEEECKMAEEFFENAKIQQKNFEAKKHKEASVKEAPKLVLLRISMDIEKARHSHILELKRAFRKHPGKTKVEIIFNTEKKKLASLHIDSSWGIDPNPDFICALNSIPCITELLT